MAETLASLFRNGIVQLLFATMAAGMGGWIGVQTALTQLASDMRNVTERVTKLESVNAYATNEHTEFRERIRGLEVLTDLQKDQHYGSQNR